MSNLRSEAKLNEEVKDCLALLAGMGRQRGFPQAGSATPVSATAVYAPT